MIFGKKSWPGALSGLCLVLSVAAAWPGQLGVNISLPERGGTFVDLVKETFNWDNTSWQPLTAQQVDSCGWPTCDAIYLADFRPVAEWSGTIDDPAAYRPDLSGTYSCSFTGQAAVGSSGDGIVQNLTYDTAANISRFNLVVPGPPVAGDYMFMLRFTNTRRTAGSAAGSGLTHLKIVRPGYPAATNKIFTDQFIQALTDAGFAAIRFMPFLATNGSDPAYPESTAWVHRKQLTDASQAALPLLGKNDGAAWEYVVRLANQAGMDPWINVPIAASADYITRLAQLFKDSLNANLKIYVESSNEVWNTAPGFEQSLYNQQQAAALGIGEHENHARRTVQLAQIFGSVFGSAAINQQVRVVLCSHQPMLKWWVEPMLQYINRTFGPPRNYLYAIACQTYYGGGAEAGESAAKILADCHAGITGQVDETGQTNEAGRKQWIQKAAAWGLPGGFCSYEGGPDHGGSSTVNVANRILAERDSLMGVEFKYNLLDCFFNLGGNLAMQFTLSSGYNRYGCWGLTDDIAQPYRNHKYQAAKEVIAALATNIARPKSNNPPVRRDRTVIVRPGQPMVFTLPPSAIAGMTVRDLQGRLVARVLPLPGSTGESRLVWDQTDEHGLRPLPGLYLYDIRGSRETVTGKIILLP